MLSFLLHLLPAAMAWKPAPSPMVTKWATDVSPSQIPEYPRPMMVRGDASWSHLNGLWQFDPNAADLKNPPFNHQLPAEILVPFPVESPLSGIRQQPPNGYMWYRRMFTPLPCSGGRILLHFEASDRDTTVWVNKQKVGQHVGGYDEFFFDVTEAAAAMLGGNESELVVGVFDPTRGVTGKQSKTALERPGPPGNGIMYASTSGIWGTVWQECVPAIRIEAVIPNSMHDLSGFTVEVNVTGPAEGLDLGIVVLGQDWEPVANATASVGNVLRVVLPLSARQTWSPNNPYLHNMTVTLHHNHTGQEVDRVMSYAGLRSYELSTQGGIVRPLLNGEFLFQTATLDQGFWPDGNYAAPTDAALKFDLEAHKAMGFNAVRKHQKVETRRWYYHADKLGVMVWQDMPCCADGTFPDQLRNVIAKRRMYTSIIQWDTFNEGGGMKTSEFVGQMVSLVRSVDPTRPVDSASGGSDLCGHLPWQGGCKFGNVTDVHHYPYPVAPTEPRHGTERVLGEYGGLLLKPEAMDKPRTEWAKNKCHGHGASSSQADLTQQFVGFSETMMKLRDQNGLSAAVYTQITDVETECNGLLTYDRAAYKVDVDAVLKANGKLTGSPLPPSPSPLPPSPTPSPPSPGPSECGACKVCFNPTNHKCQSGGVHRPKTKQACEAKHHIWCGPSAFQEYV